MQEAARNEAGIGVLFVDDDDFMLCSLRAVLRKYRDRWHMHFADSGRAALALLQDLPVDVVVADMKMPEMDGAALLAEVCARFPGTGRIILSGEAEQSALFEALKYAHQYLAKPCPTDVIVATVDHVAALARLLPDAGIREKISSTDADAAVSDTYRRLLRIARDTGAEPGELITVMEQQPGVAAQILESLRATNGGAGRDLASIDAAIEAFGVKPVCALALAEQALWQLAEGRSAAGDDGPASGRHGRQLARLAACFPERAEVAARAGIAGLLSDVGRTVSARLVAPSDPDPLPATDRRLGAPGTDGRTFRDVAARVGAYQLGLWGLPLETVHAVAARHRPGAAFPAADPEILAALHLAEACIRAGAAAAPEALPELDRPFLERVGWSERLPQLLERARTAAA